MHNPTEWWLRNNCAHAFLFVATHLLVAAGVGGAIITSALYWGSLPLIDHTRLTSDYITFVFACFNSYCAGLVVYVPIK